MMGVEFHRFGGLLFNRNPILFNADFAKTDGEQYGLRGAISFVSREAVEVIIEASGPISFLKTAALGASFSIMSEQSKLVSRQELYEAVWAKPISTLAKEWNTNYAQIAGACALMNIPRPGSGHWQTIARGYLISREPLPAARPGEQNEILLSPGGGRLGGAPRAERDQMKARQRLAKDEISPKEPEHRPNSSGELETINIEKAAEGAVLDILRQAREIDFWTNKFTTFYYVSDLRGLLGVKDENKIGDGKLVKALIAHAELQRFRAWLYAEILKPEFPDGMEKVGIFDLSTRKALKLVFSRLPAKCGDYGALPDFFEALRLLDCINLRYSFQDGGGPWLVVCEPEKGTSWRAIKDKLVAKSRDIPLEKKYSLSRDGLSLLKWIVELRNDECSNGMTPPVEDLLETDIGIEAEWDEANSRALVEVIIEEINEKTDFRLRAIPWNECGKVHTRILVKKKGSSLDDVVRTIRNFGLTRNKLFGHEEILGVLKRLVDVA